MPSIVDGIFWGTLLVAVGVWFIVRRALPVHLPVIRVVVAVLLVYAGVRLLVRGPVAPEGTTAVFSESDLRYSPQEGREYNLIFSSGSVDLTGARPDSRTLHAEVNVIFGSGRLRIDASQPVRVAMSSAFGTVDSPGGRSVAFGDTVYTTPSYREGSPALEVHATAVFARLSIAP